MVSLNQVYLLEQKVESAVAKIQQLQAENDALRSKCSELTNALSAKSEQLSNFESDQSQIEDGIKKALDRLNSIENSVLKTASQINQGGQAAKTAVQSEKPAVQPAPAPQAEEAKPVQSTQAQNAPSFDTMEKVTEEPEVTSAPEAEVVQEEKTDNIPEQIPTQDFTEDTYEGEEEIDAQEDDNHDGLGFDIF